MASPAGVGPELALMVMRSMADAVLVIGPAGAIEAASEACRAVFGWEPEDLVGRGIEVLVPGDVRPAHEQHRAQYAQAATSRPMGVGLSLRAERRDGSLCDIDVSLTPFDDEGRVLAVVRDESVQAAVRAERELVQRLLDAMSEGVFMFRPDTLELTHVNDGAVRQTGYTREQLTGGMTAVDIMVDADEAAYRETLRPLLDGGVEAIEFESLHKRSDGGAVPVDVLVQWPKVASATTNAVVPVVALSRDVSERRAAEAERERHHEWIESLSDTRLALLTGVPADDVLALVCEHVRNLTEASAALVIEPSPDGLAMTVGASSRNDSELENLELPTDGKLAKAADVAPGRASAISAAELEGAEATLAVGLDIASFLVAPLRVGVQSAGVLIVGRALGAPPWEATDADLLASYALEAATALELARARVETQRLVMLEDRERIAADLHDMVIQRLFAAGMRLQGTAPMVANAAVSQRIQEVVDDLDATIGEIRQAIFDLNRGDATAPSLEITLRDTVAANKSYLGFTPTLRVSGALGSVPSPAADQLIPVLTEALSNVARHARATRVEVVVAASFDGIELTVTDDGIGFEPSVKRGNGLDNLARRARGLGGRFEVQPGPGGAGTTITWAVGRGVRD
jgi:PAS domain S-box-containing protein